MTRPDRQTLAYWALGVLAVALTGTVGWGQHQIEMRLADEEARLAAVQESTSARSERVAKLETSLAQLIENQQEIQRAILRLDEKLDWLATSAATSKIVNVPEWQRRLDASQTRRIEQLELFRLQMERLEKVPPMAIPKPAEPCCGGR
jgi:uncharacterized protein HemX